MGTDGVHTSSSFEQRAVEAECHPLLLGRPACALDAEKHVAYLLSGLETLPAHFTSLEASRPWLCYWIVHSLEVLGRRDALTDERRADVAAFLARCQAPTGGFCGGPHPGQAAHLAPTYAAVCALVTIGTPEALAAIDRPSLRSFLLRMKDTRTGAFRMHDDGESDVRGSYCALSVAALCGLLDDELAEGAADWLCACQTYEGGMGATPGEEAHGGYTFCGLAALVLLSPGQRLRLPRLAHWLTHRQMAHVGGFQGRTNKLVDGCYSFWQGGAFPLLHSLLSARGEAPESGWLVNGRALMDYLLSCAQCAHGGLRDKPGKGRDFYHTCYGLSGLSVAVGAWNGGAGLPTGLTRVSLVHPIFNVVNARAEYALEAFI